MDFLIHALFAFMLIAGAYFAWEAYRLLTGVGSRQTRRLSHLSPEQALQARGDFIYLNIVVAVELLCIPAAALVLRWALPVLEVLFSLVSLHVVVWSFVLERRYAKRAT